MQGLLVQLAFPPTDDDGGDTSRQPHGKEQPV